MPDLLDLQIQSFEWLVGNEAWFQRRIDAGDENPMGGLEEILTEISPIEDFSGSMSLSFSDPRFDEVKASDEECRDKDMTYGAPLFVTAEFTNNTTGEIKSQTVFMGDFPVMTEQGHVHHQRHRACRRLPAGPLAGRLLRPRDRQDDREGRLLRQDHPEPGCVAGVRRRQARHRGRAHRPQAPPAGHRAAQGARLDRRADPAALRVLRDDPRHPGEGPHRRAGRGAARHLPQAASGRAAHARERADPPGEPVLQGQALRPGQGRPLQGQQEARPAPSTTRSAR